MSTLVIVIIVVVAIIVVAALVGLAARSRRRSALKDQYGSEYDRTIDISDNRRSGERDLKDRSKRREQLQLLPLSPEAIERYRSEWRGVQERFVDAPAESLAMAHTVLTSAMGERGYPSDDQDERMSLLSVDNADVVTTYRSGVATEEQWRQNGSADTEDLRLAMQSYRVVFDHVVGEARAQAVETQPTRGR